MTKREIKWEKLTREEARTLAMLRKSGTEIFAAPILIEEDAESRKRQFESLDITWDDCKTWFIGSERVRVHLTPANEATYKCLLDDLRTKHRDAYRERRCMIPGKLKPFIRCPEHNRCCDCPYPEVRDQHKANNVSWDEPVRNRDERAQQDSTMDKVDNKLEFEAVCQLIKAKSPKYLAAFLLKEQFGLSVAEIAQKMGTTERNVRFFIGEAKRLGRHYKRDNG